MNMGFPISLSLIIFFLSHHIVAGATSISIKCPFETLYQFGDSLSDTGNLIRVQPVGPRLPAARLPYGERFPGRPTGRWSDGKLITDFTASALGIPLLNPYLDKNASFKNGVNFAVAGSTALNSSFFAARGISVPLFIGSLSSQLNWFRTYLSSICSTTIECADKLRRALIFLGEIGGNDINYSLSQGKSLRETQTYVPLINQAIIDAARELIIDAGAMQILVPGNFPIGCFPFYLNSFASNNSADYDKLGCLRSLNDLAIYQNNNLKIALDSLRREFPNVAIVYADYYEGFTYVLHRGYLLGFDPRTLLKPCCGTGQSISSPQFCGTPGVPVCTIPRRYIHWDGLHLTQEAYDRIFEVFSRDILLKMKCIR